MSTTNQTTTNTTNTNTNQTQNLNPKYYENKELESFIESNYVSIKDGETKVLQFVPDKTKIVEKPDFNGKITNRAQFTVIEINDINNRREKTLELSPLTYIENI